PFLPFVLFEPRQPMSFPSGPQFHRLEVPYDADLTASKNLNVFFGKPTIANTCVYDGCYGTIRQGQIDRKVVQQYRRPPLLRNTHCITASYASPAQVHRQIHKVTGFPNQSPSANVRILDPVL